MRLEPKTISNQNIFDHFFQTSKVKTIVFNVILKLLLRMFTKLDNLPIFIDTCFLHILGTFYPI